MSNLSHFDSHRKENSVNIRRITSMFDGNRRSWVMADDASDEKAGEVRFTPSVPLWKYLGWLSRNTLLGRTENDVARQVLTDRLTEMRQEDYRDGQKP